MSYELTDAEVLSQLRKRKIKLTLELERVEIAIKAFEDVDVSGLSKFDLLAYDTDLDTTVDADLKSEARERYNPEMTNEQKIIWALRLMKEATATEIADYLIHQDEGLKNRQRVVQAITFSASRMFKMGKIDADKRGTKNFYKLKM